MKTGHIILAITTETVQQETSEDRTYHTSHHYNDFVQQETIEDRTYHISGITTKTVQQETIEVGTHHISHDYKDCSTGN